MAFVKRLNRESGLGIVMVLHDLNQTMEVSDKVIVIKDGRKVCEGPPEEVITPALLQDVYDVESDVIRLPGRNKPLIVFKEIT